MAEYEDIWEEIKDKVSLQEEMEKHGVSLIRTGRRMKCVCPFHMENNPSMIINMGEVETFKCFGCQASGSVIDFIMMIKGVGFSGAKEYFTENYALEFGKNLDIKELMVRKIREKKQKKAIASYMLRVSRKVKKFMSKSIDPIKDLEKIKIYLQLADEAAYEEYIDGLTQMGKKIDRVISKYSEKRND